MDQTYRTSRLAVRDASNSAAKDKSKRGPFDAECSKEAFGGRFQSSCEATLERALAHQTTVPYTLFRTLSLALIGRASSRRSPLSTHPPTLDAGNAKLPDVLAVLVPVVEEDHVLVGDSRVSPNLAEVSNLCATQADGQAAARAVKPMVKQPARTDAPQSG